MLNPPWNPNTLSHIPTPRSQPRSNRRPSHSCTRTGAAPSPSAPADRHRAPRTPHAHWRGSQARDLAPCGCGLPGYKLLARVPIWKYFPIRVRVRVTQWVKFSPGGGAGMGGPYPLPS